ncbi:MAG: FeoA family protein [Candidatus Asgardarchaeia archaeon]
MPWHRHGKARRWFTPPPSIPGAVPLSMVPPNSLVEVVTLNLPYGLTIRMSELGITPGAKLKVVLNQMGYVVIEILNSRYGLNPRISSNIFVRPAL